MEQENAKTPREIGRMISSYFKDHGISQEDAAARLGLASKQVVANQLYGKRFGRKVAAKYAAVNYLMKRPLNTSVFFKKTLI